MINQENNRSEANIRSCIVVLASFVCNGLVFSFINSYSVTYMYIRKRLEDAGINDASSKACKSFNQFTSQNTGRRQSFHFDMGTYYMHHLRVVVHITLSLFLQIIIYCIRYLDGRLIYEQIDIIIRIIEIIFVFERITYIR